MARRFGRHKYKKDEDFEEGDLWGVMEERRSTSPRNLKSMAMVIKDYSSVSPLISPASSSPRMIPKSSLSSSSSLASNEGCKKQFSAPLDIPDWSKIYGKNSKKKGMNVVIPASSSSTTSWVDGVGHHDGHGDGCDDGNGDDDDGHVKEEEEEQDDDDDGMVPPHEYIARKLARSQISSFSVCEGMGRTLKGRDLRKVRNAILTRTGFLE